MTLSSTMTTSIVGCINKIRYLIFVHRISYLHNYPIKQQDEKRISDTFVRKSEIITVHEQYMKHTFLRPYPYRTRGGSLLRVRIVCVCLIMNLLLSITS